MSDWLTGFGEAPAVLVTVAITEGSSPREPGARMLVTDQRQFDTIGGGHLEQRAVDIARAMLKDAPSAGARVERFALGPGLGQCCGGVMHLAFERVDAGLCSVLAALRGRRRQDSWRLTALDGPAASLLFDADGAVLAASDAQLAQQAPRFASERGTHLQRDAHGRRWLVDPCRAPLAHLTLFGAGHVGAAIVRALAHLPCHVTWVDERDDLFPPVVPANVVIEATDTPEALVTKAPPGGSFLVMTHSHALDQRLSEAILARLDTGWFGLIGSHTKRKQFEHRLHARGLPAERIASMVCPIGVPGITGKEPAVIAASVSCQLLMVWEAERAAAPGAAAPRLVASGASRSILYQF